MSNKHTILLMEDEEESGEMLANFLELNDYNVLWAKDGKQALKYIEENANEIHLAILDIMVPHHDGKEICSNIRQHPVIYDIPVLFLTARDEEQDEIEGLELGADDYIKKPASLNLVKAHVETQLRRRSPEKSNWIQYGKVYVDLDSKEMYINEELIDLTHTEYTIAEMIFQNPKLVYSRQQILEKISDEEKFVFDRTVDVHVKNLRLKMGDEGKLIKTYRGVGYGFNKEFLHA
ncbi:response regulator transcription factor [Gracilimonas amylolytica]|uniref:response regulator transcription factor n=1 Tax=Gracilimonas amylolytica TaxID=1749045 RepID=UPI000CD829A5|nr:response regulator transcription factor [Gracilimonas amylolytica]